jgi:hypothetical protein
VKSCGSIDRNHSISVFVCIPATTDLPCMPCTTSEFMDKAYGGPNCVASLSLDEEKVDFDTRNALILQRSPTSDNLIREIV